MDDAQQLGTAMAQAAAQAFRQWVAGLSRCPACGATEAPPPRPGPPAPVAPMALWSADKVGPRSSGAMRKWRHGAHMVDGRLPDGRAFGFMAWTQEIACGWCELALSFPDTDAPPVVPVVAPDEAPPPGPWAVRDRAGTRVGEVRWGPTGPLVELDPAATGPARAAPALAAALLRAVGRLGRGDEPERDALIERAIGHHLARLGAIAAPA